MSSKGVLESVKKACQVRVSDKSVLQECRVRVPRQKCQVRVSQKAFQARVSSKSVK